MRRAALFICEGTSDVPLHAQLEALCGERGLDIDISTPEYERYPGRVGKTVAEKLQVGLELRDGAPTDAVFIHRDADGAGTIARRSEIDDAVRSYGRGLPYVPVIPVRMTEAWLLLDEMEIRRVAGNPKGKGRLPLPTHKKVESIADPKAVLAESIRVASEATGRRLQRINRSFSEHRATLLRYLDRQGPVRELESWRALCADLDQLVAALGSDPLR